MITQDLTKSQILNMTDESIATMLVEVGVDILEDFAQDSLFRGLRNILRGDALLEDTDIQETIADIREKYGDGLPALPESTLEDYAEYQRQGYVIS